MKRLGTGTAVWVSAAALAAALALAAPARADENDPTGAVGWSHQWSGTELMTVDIHATGHGAPLTTAQVVVDAVPVPVSTDGGKTYTQDPLPLCPAADPNCFTGGITVKVDTSTWAPRAYHFVVVVKDADGRAPAIVNDMLTINPPPANNKTATLTIGSDVTFPQPQTNTNPPGGGIKGASQSSCTKAKLSMLLSQKPVRIKHKVPVLYKNKKYRFSGRLTCVVNNRRHSAAKRTKVDVYAIMKGKRHHKATLRVASGGKLKIRLASPSSRTLEFRFKGADGKTTRVRIKIKVVKAPKHKHKHKKHHK
jgi:hypothetical protein